MTAKEKAQQLVDRFLSNKVDMMFQSESGKIKEFRGIISKHYAKDFANFAVDEILQTNPTLQGDSDDLVTMIVQAKAYWQQVKEEIEKL
jgi:hypothetical protein